MPLIVKDGSLYSYCSRLFCISVFLYFCNPCYYLGLCCKRWPPLCPTQIARIAQLSKIGCNIRTIFVPTPVRNAAKQEEISSFWEKKERKAFWCMGRFVKQIGVEVFLVVQQQQQQEGSNWLKVPTTFQTLVKVTVGLFAAGQMENAILRIPGMVRIKNPERDTN